MLVKIRFLSTPSGWRATAGTITAYVRATGISIHALRVDGDKIMLSISLNKCISIHALRVEGDRPYRACGRLRKAISIHALRVEGDVLCVYRQRGVCISIHALRVEGDTDALNNNTLIMQFLSTPSGWRATLSTHTALEISLIFLSTPSGWRATGSFNYRNFDT